MKPDVDCEELQYSYCRLECIEDLSRYKNLHHLWVNNNRLRHVDFLLHNYRIAYLDLSNNMLTNIAGVLGHLHAMQQLFLHNNQLQFIDEIVHEFRHMPSLRTLTLFGNPVSQLPAYRAIVVFALPKLQRFDGTDVEVRDHQEAMKQCNKQLATLRRMTAFGGLLVDDRQSTDDRRSDVKRKNDQRHERTQTLKKQDAADGSKRQHSHSVMIFQTVDWSKVPTSDQRRTYSGSKKQCSPTLLTRQLKAA